ncbi:MAG TPA: hypothetical protein VN372_02665 [Methanospirillum sp.]|nr:hypothetical protein [Methanospirillum sp.]
MSKIYSNNLTDAVLEWQSYQDAELSVFKSEHSIHLVDTRIRGEIREYTYSHLSADIYLECDSARTIESLAPNFRSVELKSQMR